MRYRVAIWKRARKVIPLSDYLAASQLVRDATVPTRFMFANERLILILSLI